MSARRPSSLVVDEPALRDFTRALDDVAQELRLLNLCALLRRLDEVAQELRLLRRHLEQRRAARRPPDPPEAREFLPWRPPRKET